MIKRIYYTIWADGLHRLRSLPQNEGSWKFYGMVFISIAMAFNLATLTTVLKKVAGINFYNLNFIPDFPMSPFVKGFILFLLGPMVINYFLIFHKNKYEQLFTKYKLYNGKFCGRYILISYASPFAILIAWAIIHMLIYGSLSSR